MLDAVKFGHEKFVPIIEAIEKLAKKAGKPKWEVETIDHSDVKKKITEKFEIVSFITDQYLQESIRSIDSHFGDGYAKKNPQLVSQMMGIMDNTCGRNGGNIAEYR